MAFKMRKATIYKLVSDEKTKKKSEAENIKVQGEEKIGSLEAYHKIKGTKFANANAADELEALRRQYPTVGKTNKPK